MTTRKFLLNLLLIALFLLLVIFLTLFGLKSYTNHGQKLDLPDYIGQHVDKATKDAKSRSFKILVNDSIHKLGTPGGIILNQNPKPNSQVKENRPVYVTIAKYGIETIDSDNLPELYGRSFEMKKKELEAHEIDLVVKGYKYDIGEPNMILEATYKGKQVENRFGKKKGIKVEKGTQIEVILSENDNGETNLPDLRCKTFAEVQTLLQFYKLQLGEIVLEGVEEAEKEHAFVSRQFPSLDMQSKITMGSPIKLFLTKEKPATCN